MKPHPNPMYFISWGQGLQSTTLGVMSVFGDIKKVDSIIAADTMWEHSYTYKIRDWYINWFIEHGMRVDIVNNGNIKDVDLDRVMLPLWDSKSKMYIRRQCTFHFKISPIRNKIREILEVSPTNTGRTKKGSAILYLGISYEEAGRMKESDRAYIINQYPLVDMKFTRQDCTNYLKEKNLPVPPKSACVHCPFQGKERWLNLKKNYPNEWKEAVEFDNKIRIPSIGLRKGGFEDSKMYLWKGLKSLEEEDFESIVKDEEEICDEGYCFI